ncbi:MAG TPA: polysaccharide deacetylase family protein [Aliidongia sp.]|nr:polysaccharide deacetylase family protein [Aliidongia sp.]
MSLSARTVASSPRASIWAPLETELDTWAQAGQVARFWWRDDDATAPSAPLDRLLQLAGDLPLALAVIPEAATDALAHRLAQEDNVTVLQHGIAHINHAAPPGKKAELGSDRPPALLATALKSGRERLEALFGRRFRPVLVPPWNRIAADLVPLLSAAGFVGLSTAGARPKAEAAPGLRQVNTHLDPIDWHGTRRCRPTADLVVEAARRLADRRLGAVDAAEPVGFLTHHRLDDPTTERFAADLAALVAAHPAAAWVSARELWPA